MCTMETSRAATSVGHRVPRRAIKDSPAVERALNRSKIYLLVLMEHAVLRG